MAARQLLALKGLVRLQVRVLYFCYGDYGVAAAQHLVTM